jgi:hypothetical protein
MEVHGAPRCDMDCFIKEFVRLFHDRQSRGHLSLSFCIQFFMEHSNITLQCALAFAIEKKIALAGDVCLKPLIIFRFHNFHLGDIKRVVG